MSSNESGARIIDGKAIAQEFRREVRAASDRLAARGLRRALRAAAMRLCASCLFICWKDIVFTGRTHTANGRGKQVATVPTGSF